MGDEMVKVRVKVMAREGFRGYYALQQFFPAGQTDLEITQAQLAELAADTGPITFLELPSDFVIGSPEATGPSAAEIEAALKHIAVEKAKVKAAAAKTAGEAALAKATEETAAAVETAAAPPPPPPEAPAEEAPPEPEPTKKTRFR